MICPFCRDDLIEEAPTICGKCNAAHHAECWAEGRNRCSSCRSWQTGGQRATLNLRVRRAYTSDALMASAIDVPLAFVYEVPALLLGIVVELFCLWWTCCYTGLQIFKHMISSKSRT